ncbi:MAG TPA: phage tail protein [Methanosarcina sp.]|nr:phage tail protein [Methanosarcina sp.]
METNFKVTGQVKATLLDENGIVKYEYEGPNLVVSAGLTFIASRMTGTAANVMSHMAVGSGSTSPSSGQTTLVSELGRVALSSSTSSSNQVTYSATFGAGVGTGTIAEAGIFNAASAGTMLARTTSISVTKGASDTLIVTWTVSVN